MTAQPEALRLADALIAAAGQTDAEDDVIHVARWFVEDAAAELRRLSAENEAIKAERNEDRRREYGYSQQVVDALTNERDVLLAQRDALLEALKMIAGTAPCIDNLMSDKDIARAAIKAAEGEQA